MSWLVPSPSQDCARYLFYEYQGTIYHGKISLKIQTAPRWKYDRKTRWIRFEKLSFDSFGKSTCGTYLYVEEPWTGSQKLIFTCECMACPIKPFYEAWEKCASPNGRYKGRFNLIHVPFWQLLSSSNVLTITTKTFVALYLLLWYPVEFIVQKESFKPLRLINHSRTSQDVISRQLQANLVNSSKMLKS